MTKVHQCLAALLFAASFAASAASVSLTASADTNITRHPNLGSGLVSQGKTTALAAIAPEGWESYPLLRFDLSSLAGHTALSDATLALTFANYYVNPVDLLLGQHAVG